MRQALMVFVTIPEPQAKKMAEKLLAERLCACINIMKGVTSFFWWKNKIDCAKEALMVIKTQEKKFPALKKFIESHHPYTVCEIIACRIDKINQKYLSWLIKESNDR